jgi:hypothetical protein
MALERSRGDRYALSALKNRRALLAAEIVQLERQVRARKESLGHVDATLRLLDPAVDIDALPSKRIVKRIRLFRQGELGRLILGVMRNANSPIGTHAIVAAIIKAGGHGPGARSAVMPRVRGNLAYLNRRQKVIKSGSGKATRWTLA